MGAPDIDDFALELPAGDRPVETKHTVLRSLYFHMEQQVFL